ncbi:hypothetical protein [Mycobacteroides abscessus]|uniref:hypothetical protein n=1 Tax=Mycobacteroides abscessus TaxID=36809 RepID=UPI00178235C6|nr:hypothetical protein [Mycobacteroides abscessus]MBE5462781.1 hypothetical protein [Mycobacteroides abscessus]QOF41032.1 hypothetical protein E3G69_000041 [Mycobacteroides abscessus]QOF45732.1 hypothetical protein E3G70_000041 [Mycobacteroides abscessus]
MSQVFRVNAETLHLKASEVLDHMDLSRREHSGHADDLNAAAGRWNGEIASALTQLATTWTDQRAGLHKRIGNMSTGMSEAAIRYVDTEDNSKANIAKTGEAM